MFVEDIIQCFFSMCFCGVWSLVRDDPKLPFDGGEVLILNEVIGGSIPAMKSSLYLAGEN